MKSLVLLLCAAAACSATFSMLPSISPDAYKVCVYSHSPDRYTPKCFPCLKVVYPNALLACVNASAMPSNITYDGAKCLESNCAINYPKSPVASSEGKFSFIQEMAKLFMDTHRSRRSVDDNSVENEAPRILDLSEVHIIAEIRTLASDMETFVDEIDYAD